MTHKEWLDNEYNQWVEALSSCTVHNFKENPMVKRMLGGISPQAGFYDLIERGVDWNIMAKIDKIGSDSATEMSGIGFRYIYYAQQILKRNPSSVCEIGGGAGQFYAILRALGYKGAYYIRDIKPVREFQMKYLQEVERATGLKTMQTVCEFDILVSFYALGEFDDETRKSYANTIDFCPHGYIAWNPHSGASDDLSIFSKHNISVIPGIEEGIKIISW